MHLPWPLITLMMHVTRAPHTLLQVVFEASHTFDKVAQALNVVQSLVLPFALIPVGGQAACACALAPGWLKHVGLQTCVHVHLGGRVAPVTQDSAVHAAPSLLPADMRLPRSVPCRCCMWLRTPSCWASLPRTRHCPRLAPLSPRRWQVRAAAAEVLALPAVLCTCLGALCFLSLMDKPAWNPQAIHPAHVSGLLSAAINGYLLVDFMRTSLPADDDRVVAGTALFIAAYYLIVLYFAVCACGLACTGLQSGCGCQGQGQGCS